MSVSKKKRTHKVSEGLRKHSKHPLSAVEKVLEGKGLMQSIKHVPILRPWLGVASVTTPWNAKNVAENRRLYPHLFPEDRK
jgi:hypothetical protein